jgi:peptidoglycan LD-endopeptidase CwlK
MSGKSGSVGGGGGNVGKSQGISGGKSGGQAPTKSPVKANSAFTGGSFNVKAGFNAAAVTKANLMAKLPSVAPPKAKTTSVAAPKMDPASEAKLAKINPQVANRLRNAAADLKKQGPKVSFQIALGKRTDKEQKAYYAQSREPLSKVNALRKSAGLPPITAAENKIQVTKAKTGVNSNHYYGLAADIVPVVNGKRTYNKDKKIPAAQWDKIMDTIGAAGKKQGLEWGGDWKKKDLPHFQLSGGANKPTDWLSKLNTGGEQAVWNEVNKQYPTVN